MAVAWCWDARMWLGLKNDTKSQTTLVMLTNIVNIVIECFWAIPDSACAFRFTMVDPFVWEFLDPPRGVDGQGPRLGRAWAQLQDFWCLKTRGAVLIADTMGYHWFFNFGGHLGGSWNGGTSKWMTFNNIPTKMDDLGYPHFRKPPFADLILTYSTSVARNVLQKPPNIWIQSDFSDVVVSQKITIGTYWHPRKKDRNGFCNFLSFGNYYPIPDGYWCIPLLSQQWSAHLDGISAAIYFSHFFGYEWGIHIPINSLIFLKWNIHYFPSNFQ